VKLQTALLISRLISQDTLSPLPSCPAAKNVYLPKEKQREGKWGGRRSKKKIGRSQHGGSVLQDSSDFIEATYAKTASRKDNEINVISSSGLHLNNGQLRSNEFKVTRSSNDVSS
jgi:hypothetical protein